NVYDKVSHSFVGKGELGGVMGSEKEWNILYKNNGNGTFTKITEKAGLVGRGWAGDAVAFDYDEDGKTDLLVTSMFGRAQLYKNNGARTFTDVTLEVLGRPSWGATGARAFDYDNDGKLDLLLVDMHSDMWMGLDYTHASEAPARAYEKVRFPWLHGPRVER